MGLFATSSYCSFSSLQSHIIRLMCVSYLKVEEVVDMHPFLDLVYYCSIVYFHSTYVVVKIELSVRLTQTCREASHDEKRASTAPNVACEFRKFRSVQRCTYSSLSCYESALTLPIYIYTITLVVHDYFSDNCTYLYVDSDCELFSARCSQCLDTIVL